MKKNTASQIIGAQMITAADGSDFTGAVTVAVTGDNGTKTTGSVGAGACTHKGTGYHSYTPAQAETNYDHVAFTFTGTGAITVTVQVYPTTLSTDVALILEDTGSTIPTMQATIAGYIDTEVAAIKAQTDQLTFTVAGKVDSTPTLTAAEREALADALLNRNIAQGSNGGRTVEQALAFLRNKWTVSGTTLTVYDTDDTTSLWTATITATAGADPITASDPA